MKQKILCLLAGLLLLVTAAGCADDVSFGIIGGADGPTSIFVGTSTGDTDLYEDAAVIDEDGTYNSPEDVSLYLYTYDCLPDHYLTKTEANALGWSGGSVERFGDGYAIGGDRFQNRERALPHTDGRLYYECDVNTWGKNERGPERIVWSNDGLIYYTPDHYATFILLYGEE